MCSSLTTRSASIRRCGEKTMSHHRQIVFLPGAIQARGDRPTRLVSKSPHLDRPPRYHLQEARVLLRQWMASVDVLHAEGESREKSMIVLVPTSFCERYSSSSMLITTSSPVTSLTCSWLRTQRISSILTPRFATRLCLMGSAQSPMTRDLDGPAKLPTPRGAGIEVESRQSRVSLTPP